MSLNTIDRHASLWRPGVGFTSMADLIVGGTMFWRNNGMHLDGAQGSSNYEPHHLNIEEPADAK